MVSYFFFHLERGEFVLFSFDVLTFLWDWGGRGGLTVSRTRGMADLWM